MVKVPHLHLSDPWWPVAAKLHRGEPLRKDELDEMLAKEKNPPFWVRVIYDEHEREKKWAKGRPPDRSGSEQLKRIFKAQRLYEHFYEEEKTRGRQRGEGSPSDRARERVAGVMKISSETVRDLLRRR